MGNFPCTDNDIPFFSIFKMKFSYSISKGNNLWASSFFLFKCYCYSVCISVLNILHRFTVCLTMTYHPLSTKHYCQSSHQRLGMVILLKMARYVYYTHIHNFLQYSSRMFLYMIFINTYFGSQNANRIVGGKQENELASGVRGRVIKQRMDRAENPVMHLDYCNSNWQFPH